MKNVSNFKKLWANPTDMIKKFKISIANGVFV